MKQRKFLVVLLALVMMLCVCAVVACTVKEQAKATGVTLDVGKLGTLQEGATLDVSKLKITVSYSDNTQKDIAVSDVTLKANIPSRLVMFLRKTPILLQRKQKSP